MCRFSYEMLVNRTNLLTSDFNPPDLKEVAFPFNAEMHSQKRFMERQAGNAAACLFCHSQKDGMALYGISGYRSYQRQEEIYKKRMSDADAALAVLYVAPPGGSEHQTGLALDVSCPQVGLELTEAFADTSEGKWLRRYAPLYGFILRYPKGKETITGYAYEPWHIRYVTKPLALYLTITGLTLEEYHAYPPTVPSDVP